jgi:hypothetical protein
LAVAVQVSEVHVMPWYLIRHCKRGYKRQKADGIS